MSTVVIPTTPIWLRYLRLRKLTDPKQRLAEVQDLFADPRALAVEYAASVSHFADYDNRGQPFYDSARTALPVGPTMEKGSHVAAWLEHQDAVVVTEPEQRTLRADPATGLDDVEAEALGWTYLERELLLQRTQGPSVWDDGRPNDGNIGIRPDVVLANHEDRTPIVGELKVADDMDAAFALVQALACAAHLATESQRARLKAYTDREVAGREAQPRIDLYILFAGEAKNPLQPEFTKACLTLVPQLLVSPLVSATIRRVAGIELELDETLHTLNARVRFALAAPEPHLEMGP